MLKKFRQYCLILENQTNDFDKLKDYLLKSGINKTREGNLNGSWLNCEVIKFYKSVLDDSKMSEKKFDTFIQIFMEHLLYLKSEQVKKDVSKTKDVLTDIKDLMKMDSSGESLYFPKSIIEWYLKGTDARYIGDLHKLLVDVMKDFGVL